MIKLIDVTKENFLLALDMKITEDQSKYLFPVERSLAECFVNYDYIPKIIFNDDTAVGFVLLKLNKEKNIFKVVRFLIDKRYQKQGNGYLALHEIIEFFKKHGAKKVELSHEKENHYPVNLYKKVGFKYTGFEDEKEKYMEFLIE